jgi:hypothetical protein
MPDGYDVLTEELRTHAGKVDGFVDRLRTAADAANQVTMNNDAFGVLCQPFAMLLQPFEEMGSNAVSQAVQTVTDTAGKLRDTAGSYDTTDTAEAQTFTTIEGEL